MADTGPMTMPRRAGRVAMTVSRPASTAWAGSESREPSRSDRQDRWIAGAQAGDEAAFTELYLDTQPRLLRYATVLAGPDAEEVTAEAWLQIVRDLPGFTGDLDAFRGWASRIVRNRAIDFARARGRRPVEARELATMPDQPTVQDAATAAVDNLATEWAIGLIARLPTDQAEAVLLRAVMGLDAKAAGAVLGKRAGAVRVAAHRGLKTLARMLAEADHPMSGDA